MDMEKLIKNNIFEVTIEGYSSEGMGVCRIDGRAVFVPRTIVGEQWRIRIVKVTNSSVYARAEEALCLSESRTQPECPYFLKCGGCDLWHMSYEEELSLKLNKVNNALAHIGRQQLKLEEIIPADSLCSYRNKAIYAVSDADGVPRCGFFRERSHQLIPVERCLIQNELSDRAAAHVTEFMKAHGIPAYDEATGKGSIRHVFCRRAVNTDDSVLCLVAAKGLGKYTEAFVRYMRANCPELTGIVLNINKSSGNTVLAGDFYTLWGKPDMEDVLCGHKFSIAPQAFYQINPPQAEKLYNAAVGYALPTPGGLVFELYCGAGTISLSLAERADKVIAAEIVPQAVENAQENAKINGIDNVEFICADAGEAADSFEKQGLQPDVVVVDPPRKGMSRDAIEAVCRMSPERIVYVSCNCATLARDILVFSNNGYRLISGKAVDMFPRTSHIETVCLLSRK